MSDHQSKILTANNIINCLNRIENSEQEKMKAEGELRTVPADLLDTVKEMLAIRKYIDNLRRNIAEYEDRHLELYNSIYYCGETPSDE